MARFKAKTLWGVAAGLLIPAAGVALADGFDLPPHERASAAERQLCQDTPLRSRTYTTLNDAIETYRRGDYETAERLFKAAQAGWNDLTPQQQADLNQFVTANSAALQGRRDAAELLRQAELAERDGNAPRSLDLAQKALANQYLSPVDKPRAVALVERLRTRGPIPGSPPIPAVAKTDGRAKLVQARQAYNLGDFDKAEALAHEAERAGVPNTGDGDTPRKVIDEVVQARSDPKKLLTFARQAYQNKDYDRAELLAKAAEKAEPSWTMHVWGDSPGKVLKDVQAARAPAKPADPSVLETVKNALTGGKKPDAPPVADPMKATPVASNDLLPKPEPMKVDPPKPDPTRVAQDNAKARQLLDDGRKALRDGKLDQAKKYALDADAMKATLDPKDDTPAKLLADIQRAESQRATTVATAKPDVKPEGKPVVKEPPVDPKVLLKQGRDQLNAGKFDEAFKLAQKARSAPGATWGLFDLETPDKLIADIDKARAKHDKEEAARLLALARQKMEVGTPEALKEADKLTYKAETLHGSYSVWEYFEDQPTKLRAEIAARQKGKPYIPPPPSAGGAVAGNDAGAGRWTGGVANPPAVDDVQVAKARGMMIDARSKAKAGTPGEAEFLIEAVEDMNIPAEKLGKESPTQVRLELKSYGLGTRMVKANPVKPPPVGVAPATPNTKEQAKALLADARRLQAQGRLIEARAKVMEAQRYPATFGADEDRPEKALLELAGAAQRRIDMDVSRADDLVRNIAQRPIGLGEAETNLSEAQALAQGFGLDRRLIEDKLAWVRTARNNAAVAGVNTSDQKVTPVVANANDGGPQTEGRKMLEASRLELRSGNTSMARRLAEQAFQGQFGLQEEATALLRSIDTEEFRQKQRAARDTYEAGHSAFLRKDYQYAAGILRSIDATMLTDLQKSQLRDLLSLPEMQTNRPPVAVATNLTPDNGSAGNPNGPGRMKATDEESRQADLMHQIASLENIKIQKLRRDSIESLSTANSRAREGNLDGAIEILQHYLEDVSATGLQGDAVRAMRKQVDSRLHQFELVRDQNQRYDAVDDKTKKAKDKVAQNMLAEQNKQQRLKELMEEYTKLFKSAKYAEAQTYAEQAHDIDPDNPVVTAAMQIAQTQKRLTDYRKIDKKREDTSLQYLNEVEDTGDAVTSKNPMKLDLERHKIALNRKTGSGLIENRMTPAERDIERKMSIPVHVSFKDTSLSEAIEILSNLSNQGSDRQESINIAIDAPSLRDAGVALDRPVTLRLDNISMKSALNLLLDQVGLAWTIRNDALVITTKEKARGEIKLVIYPVHELVVPLDPPPPTTAGTLIGYGQASNPASPPPNSAGATPFSPGGSSGSSSPGSTFASSGNGGGSMTSGTWVKGGATTRENELIQFIQETIAPRTWASMGGQGTISYFPMTMTLAINQMADVQEQISDLLNSLRRLQDVEVAVEYRLISLDEDFYEKIGVDFAMNIINKSASKYEPTLLSGAFQAPGQIQTFQPNHFISGLTPAGTFTSDLGFPIAASSYNLAYNNLFGGFPNNPLGNGGINLGLAFLSDIQVYMLLEAAQGNNRAQVMQAPRVTAFNGQQATLTAVNTQPYVLGTVFQANPFLTVIPGIAVQNFPLTNRGATISVTPVISADRRFVRLTQQFTLTNTVPTVPIFPVVQALPIIDGGQGVGFTLVTNYIQQPAQDFMSVQTSVAVPDGGTVLIGGFKQLSESRSEYGPPLIGKIPYLDRLFRNVGYGREVQNLVFLVTPRIIINEEEEQIQVGGAANGPRP